MTRTGHTLDELRRSLHEAAGEHPAPSPGDLLRDLRAERSLRSRARASRGAVAAAAAVVVGAAGVQLLDGGDPAPAPPPAEGTGSTDERGWVLDDGTPPEQADGLVRVETLAVPYDAPDGLTLPDAEGAGADDQRFAVLWCEVGPDDAAITPPSLRLRTSEDDVVDVPCLPESGGSAPGPVTTVPLPPGEQVEVEPAWQGDVPSAGEAVLGVYREASWSEYSFPGWPEPPLSAPAHGPDAVVIDPGSATSAAVGGVRHGGARSATVTLTRGTTLELWRGVPGGLEVDVDGVRVTDDGEGRDGAGDAADDAWQEADPELRDGAWHAFIAGQRRSLALPEDVLPEPGTTRTVTVTVIPRAGDEHWQVAVLGTATPPGTVTPSDPGAQDPATDLPEWYAGHRLAATWLVPRTGVATELELPADLTDENAQVAWALRCAASRGRDGGVLGTARIIVDGVSQERVCTPGLDEALYTVGVASGFPPSEVGPGSTVQVAAPLDPEGGSALLAAYVPVPFEEFDFAAAEAADVMDPTAAVRGDVAVDQTVDAADLTDGTVTELTMAPGTVGIRLTTEGVGRVRLLVDGSPAEGWEVDEDGWWTSWTDDRVTAVPVAWVQAPSPGGELRIEVDGYPDGAVQVEVLVASP